MSSTPSQPPPTTAVPAQSDPAAFAHVANYIETRCNASPIYAFLFTPDLKLTHVSKGLVVARLPVTANHLNTSGSIHGSVSATIVDWAGGLAIAAWDLREATGVSVDINISYLSGAKLGDEVEIEGRVEKVGGSLAFTHVNIYKVAADGTRGATVANGRHTKFVRSR